MLFGLNMIKDIIERIETLKKQVKNDATSEDLITYKQKFYPLGYDLALAAGETAQIAIDRRYGDAYYRTLTLISLVKQADSVANLKTILNSILELFKDEDPDSFAVANAKKNARRKYGTVSATYDPTLMNNNVIREIFTMMHVPGVRDVNLFYPNCFDGKNLYGMQVGINKINVYGNTHRDLALPIAKKRFHKVAKGDLRGSRIQNKAFDILYIEPRIRIFREDDDLFSYKREERDYINNMLKYVREDGVVIITMPYFRLYKDVCMNIGKHLKNIEIIKVDGQDFNELGLVHIVGQKDSAKTVREKEYAKLRNAYNFNNIPSYQQIKPRPNYTLPRTGIQIELFKGSEPDFEELNKIIRSSSLMEKMWDSQKVKKLDENAKRPLLPFNIGQLGLVLTSGCLDGVVEEQEGYCHLIKGRVAKKTIETEERKADDTIEVTHTVTNKVEINVVMPDGTFKVLA